MSWGITADKLNQYSCRVFSKSLLKSPICGVVIAFGVILMVILMAFVVLRLLPLFDVDIELPYLIEVISMAVMSVVWFILGIVIIAKRIGSYNEINAAIAGAWLAGLLHGATAVVVFLHGKDA